MFEAVMTDGFATELEKLGFDPLSVLAALGAVGGGIFGAADPSRFDPGWIDKSVKGGTGVKGRLASGLLGAATIGGVMSLPAMLAAPFDEDEDDIRTASVALASYRGGRNALKSSRLRQLFQPRADAVRTFLENMKP